MGGLLKPIRKIFKRKNLKKIALGVGIAAATYFTGGAIWGALTPGMTAASGIATAASNLGSVLGIGGAAAAPASQTFTGAQLAAGGVLPAGLSASAGTTAVSQAAPAAAAGIAAPSSAISTGLGAGLAGTSATGAAPLTLGFPASSVTGATGSGLGQAAGAFNFGTVASGGGASADAFGGTAALSNAIAGASGGQALNIGAQTAPLTRQSPVTPAEASRRPTNVSPLTPGGQPQGLGNPIIPSTDPSFESIPTGGNAGDTTRTGFGGGLLQTVTGAAGAAGDWFTNLPEVVQFGLLRGVERGFAGDPLAQRYELQDRLERKRMQRTRAPAYRGGRFI